VLCGGEASELVGELQHTSIVYLGRAYEELRTAGVPRDHIIVIGSLDEYRTFLRGGVPGLPDIVTTRQLEATDMSCRRLLAEGGADYDYTDVNPATLRRVLLGIGPGKAVPTDCTSLFFALYSHGDKHQSLAGEESEEPMKNEWFAHFPYPCPPLEQSELYSYVATAAARELKGRNRPTYYLYGSTIRAILAELFNRSPTRPVIGLLNYCLSGGNLAFMKNDAARRMYGCDEWPLLLMSSAGANKEALVAGLWSTWHRGLAQGIQEASALQAGGNTGSLESAASGRTLGDLYAEAECAYYKENVYELLNHIKYRCNVPETYQNTFHQDLQHAVTAGPGGRPDMALVSRLQVQYRAGKRYDTFSTDFGVSIRVCGWGGHEVDLVKVVAHSLQQIAMPDCVHGGLPGLPKGEGSVMEIKLTTIL
jgi:hypothetical protein